MITITAEQIERVNLILSGVPGGIEKALSSTIRRANNTVRSETLKGITTVYAITRQNVRAETTIKVRTQSSDGGIVGTVLFAGHKIPLYRFNVSPTIPIQRATVSAAVLAGNGRTPFQDAFIARMQSGHARRTAVRLTFAGVDISTDINKHLLSLTYTDNEEDKTDDLQLSLDDREGVWLGNWLNTPGASKGVEISAVIVQKNWESNGKDRVLDCGVFEIDTVDGSGPPPKVTIKAGSIPYKSTVRTQKKTKAWENYTLSSIAKEIAGKNGLTCMFESAFDPLYTRKEQIQESDITFLQRLCKAAGISLKVTAKIIVLFDAAAYEQKDAVRVIKRGTADVSSWSFSTSLHDASYSKCHVSYTDPTTGKTIEYTYTPRNADKDGQVLEVNEKVSNREEARQLAMKRLRQKNKGEFKASFKLTGDARLVAGITVQVSGYGAFDGKYIIETATHSVSKSGYKTDLTLRRVLEGY